jgi:hypothetical protein
MSNAMHYSQMLKQLPKVFQLYQAILRGIIYSLHWSDFDYNVYEYHLKMKVLKTESVKSTSILVLSIE